MPFPDGQPQQNAWQSSSAWQVVPGAPVPLNALPEPGLGQLLPEPMVLTALLFWLQLWPT
jgi:hypothetical protein